MKDIKRYLRYQFTSMEDRPKKAQIYQYLMWIGFDAFNEMSDEKMDALIEKASKDKMLFSLIKRRWIEVTELRRGLEHILREGDLI